MKSSVNSGNSTKPSSPHSSIEFEERVRYSETDRMGVAHNKNYLVWFEIGRTEFCRNKNISYKDIESRGYFLVVVEAFCKFRKPLKYDDRFLIKVSLRELTPKKVIFDYELLTRDPKTIIAKGYTVHIVTDSQTNVSSLPPDIMEKMNSHPSPKP